jgi:limonene-1,2-epoxide hydrolase
MSENIERVEEFFRAMEAKDVDRVLSMMADDVEYQNVPLPPARGKKAVGMQLGVLAKAVQGFEVEIHSIAENEGVVLTERTDVMILAGARMAFWVCGRLDVRDGKIVLWRDYFDWGTVAAAGVCAMPKMILDLLCGRARR